MGRQGLAREYSWTVGFLGIGLFMFRLLSNSNKAAIFLSAPILVFLLLFVLLELSHLQLKDGLTVSLSFSAILGAYLLYGEMGSCAVSLGALASGFIKRKNLRVIIFNTSVLLLASMVASRVVLKTQDGLLQTDWTSQAFLIVPFVLPFMLVNGVLVFYYGYLNSPEKRLSDLGYSMGLYALHMAVASLLGFIMVVIYSKWGIPNFYLSTVTIAATVKLVSMAGRNALSKEGLVNLYRAASSINEALTLQEVFEKAYASSKSIMDIDFAWLAVKDSADDPKKTSGPGKLTMYQTWAKSGIDVNKVMEQLAALQERKESLRRIERLYWNKDRDKPQEGYLGKILSMPLVHKGQFLAEFGIASLSTREVTHETLGMFAILSSHMALAVDNALKYEKANQLASIDPLTCLYNYREFYSTFDRLIEKNKGTGSPVSLIYIDLDRFRDVNNKYGHQIGDKVLKEIGSIFKQSCRETDLVARIGGDEFAVILPGARRPQASQVAERIKENLQQASFWPTLPPESLGTISASIGVAVYPEDGKSVEDLIRHADMSMFSSKLLTGKVPDP